MTKWLREPVQVTEAGHGAPRTFSWRSMTYQVQAVLGHWREDASYWAGGGIEIPQRDLWRVEAAGTSGALGTARRRGIFELVHEDDRWQLARLWD